MEDRNNNFYGESRKNDYEDRFNRFDGDANRQDGNEHPQRRRFVRSEPGTRQYSKVERGPRNYDNRGYGQGERDFRQNNSGNGRNDYSRNDQMGESRPRFYRERQQGEGRSYDNDSGQQRPYDEQRQYRPRQNNYGQNNFSQNPYGQRRPGGNGQYGAPQRRKPGIPKGKRIEYHEDFHNPDEEIRLNKFLSNAGVCSRREADDFIKAGVVKVNGKTVTELGCKIKRGDNVLFHDQLVSIERKIYILLNKPKDCVTTVDDPQERKTVMDYVKNACHERIYPVGRLDRNTTGVLLLTNDGEMATKLTHPRFMKKKIYHARLDRNVSTEDLGRLMSGVDVGDGDMVHADEVDYVNDDKTQVGIEIHSGRNRIVRRMFDALGYKVVRLDRVQFAGLTKKRLRRGDWRFLTDKEVNMLRMGAYE